MPPRDHHYSITKVSGQFSTKNDFSHRRLTKLKVEDKGVWLITNLNHMPAESYVQAIKTTEWIVKRLFR